MEGVLREALAACEREERELVEEERLLDQEDARCRGLVETWGREKKEHEKYLECLEKRKKWWSACCSCL